MFYIEAMKMWKKKTPNCVSYGYHNIIIIKVWKTNDIKYQWNNINVYDDIINIKVYERYNFIYNKP